MSCRTTSSNPYSCSGAYSTVIYIAVSIRVQWQSRRRKLRKNGGAKSDGARSGLRHAGGSGDGSRQGGARRADLFFLLCGVREEIRGGSGAISKAPGNAFWRD